MSLVFRDAVAAALPSEERLRERLARLPDRAWTDLALLFAAALPEIDGVIALQGGEAFARALAAARGIPVLHTVNAEHNLFPGEVALVTGHLQGGLPEMQALMRAERYGLRVLVAVAAIERTGAMGRTRLELHDTRVQSAVQLADTPGGLTFERRTPPGLLRLPS
ncbi:hypothetical protein [Deinococcus aerius]|uniref:hypothetical protein n=1 Tax=Deinococcus aerius TaxID=200253 RepID=UPI000CCC17EC|nr:hypothetical protein [Deinococcus aerius]